MPERNTKASPGICTFTDHSATSGLKNKRKLGGFLCRLVASYRNKPVILGYSFLNDEDLLHMNQHYLAHDTYTDIITFDLSEKQQESLLGDIYISVDRVRENAKTFGIPYQAELLRVIIHGALHLCGFKDKTRAQQAQMRELENQNIEAYRNEA